MVKRLQIDGVMGAFIALPVIFVFKEQDPSDFYQADFCDYTKQKSQCPEGHWLFCM